MLSNSHHHVWPDDEAERTYLESLIREDFEQCHPGDTLENVRCRTSFLLRDWMAVAAGRVPAR
jgi:hypothetical protein